MSAPPAPKPACARLPFDRYQRYALAARVARAVDAGRRLRVLEVGSNVHGDLASFLDDHDIVSLDRFGAPDGDAGRFVRGDGCAIPFEARSFDVVLALDVLEHVPADRRPDFLAEALRVASCCVVIAAPFASAEVEAHEERLAGYFRDLHGSEFPWLAEHAAYGLPDLARTLAAVRAAGWSGATRGAGNLALWAKLMQAHFYVSSEPALLELRGDVDELYNTRVADADWAPPVYRHFVVGAPTPETLASLMHVLEPNGPITDDALLRLQGRLDRLYEVGARQRSRGARDAAAAAHAAELAEQAARDAAAATRAQEVAEHAARDARMTMLETRLREQELTVLRLEAALAARRRLGIVAGTAAARDAVRRRAAAFSRAAAGVLRAGLRLWRSRTHAIRLEPLNEVVADGDGFRSLGDDPQLALRSTRRRLPRAWAWVSFTVESGGERLSPRLYVDAGHGFAETTSVPLPVRGGRQVTRLVRLPDRVHALRLDPMTAPGRFVLRDVTIREIGTLHLLTTLLGRVRDASPGIDRTRVATRALAIVRAHGIRALARRLLAHEPEPSNYPEWVETYDTLTDVDRALIRRHVDALAYKPLISIVMPTYETPERWLRRAIESVARQLYPHWELCIADDGSTAPHVRRVLEEYRARDPRIRVVLRPQRGHISAASNSAIELVRGEFTAFLDHDDELAEHALYLVAVELGAHPTAEVVYTDEDKLDDHGNRIDPYFKPDWNPDLFLAQNLVTHLCVCRTARVREVGGFRVGYEGAQDWDLVMRITERIGADDVRHIPHVCYHWRAVSGSTALAIGEKRYATAAQQRTLSTHFARRRESVDVLSVAGICWRVRYPLPRPAPLVSVVIPTRDQAALLRRAVASVRERTVYPHVELVVVDNGSADPATLAYLDELAHEPDVRVVRYDGPFNFAALNNLGVRHARGDVLALVNDDVEALGAGWLEEMVSQACRPEIGAVGAMLYYPDDTIQHAGIVLGLGTSGIAAHAYSRRPRGFAGQIGRALLAQTMSAVTAACLVVRRAVFEEVGGFDEAHLAIAYNDVDLCLRLRERGYRTLWTPYAELYHVESASRGYEDTPAKRERFEREVAYMRRRWGDTLAFDPAYNPNLSLTGESFTLAFPPRTEKPWREAPVPIRIQAVQAGARA